MRCTGLCYGQLTINVLDFAMDSCKCYALDFAMDSCKCDALDFTMDSCKCDAAVSDEGRT